MWAVFRRKYRPPDVSQIEQIVRFLSPALSARRRAMRHNTQSTITDRVLGIRRDRQGIAVVSVGRCMTVLLGVFSKRAVGHMARQPHAGSAWGSAWPTSFGPMGPEQPRLFAALCPAPVEALGCGRC
jgi:hypothetical protein